MGSRAASYVEQKAGRLLLRQAAGVDGMDDIGEDRLRFVEALLGDPRKCRSKVCLNLQR
jgi:hypothetical protein